ncbi:alpha-2-macroglobulin family protein [Pusillimonas sp.]|uniref:alpha-2-macroglobulin family protein n=1 Tax=Pusillimonas sp. TaxID=3040095 RepID=UPI0029AE53B3|nr:MG2 domain-containing protein [Pusillimonas sp.]MDX3895796.1 MG2 domain-containing protein [Pusillimonas sp.]
MKGRGVIALWLLSMAVPVHAAHISHFSPQGTVATIESVKATFDQEVVAFGDAAAPAPLRISCDDESLVGDGRWTDAKNWTYVFRTAPGPGVTCTASVDAGFRTLSGQAVTGKTSFSFATGGPHVVSRRPYGDTVDEDQIFLLQFNGAVDAKTLRANAHCTVEGLGEAVPVRLVDDPAQRKAILEAAYMGDSMDDQAVQLLQCKRLLPAEAQLRLVIGKGVAASSGVASTQAQVFDFKVRPPFQVSTSCQRENANAPCTPVLPIVVLFNAPVPAEQASRVRLRSAGKEIEPDRLDEGDAQTSTQRLVFSGPFEPESELQLVLPDDLRDDAGRPLSNTDQLPLSLRTAAYPSLVKFSSGTFGTIERFANVPPGVDEDDHPPTVPLTVRNVERELPARDLSRPLGTVRDYVPGDDEEVLRWYAGLQRLDGGRWTRQQIGRILDGDEPGEGGDDALDVRGYSVLRDREGVRALTLPGAQQGDARPLEVIGVPVAEPGFHVLEVESARLGGALLGDERPMYVRSAVLVTNLGVHLKQGRDDALVWVSTLDEGRVVRDAEIRVLDCSGRLLAEGRTDANGLWHHEGALDGPDYCSDTGLSGLYVSARIPKDHELARGKDDFAFVLSDWNAGMESWRFNVPTDMRPAPTVVTHTVFDRSLFRAGETVSMKHFARMQTRDGLALPDPDQLPDKLVIMHQGSGQSHEEKLTWEKTPSGGLSARSEFQLTRSAKLGDYSVTLQKGDDYAMPDGRFRVEEFKLPVLAGSLKISRGDGASRLVAPTVLNADLQIGYVSGGPAAKLPVSLSALRRDKYLSYGDYDDYSFAPPSDAEGETSDSPEDADQRLFLDKQAVTLDEQGAARVKLDALPEISRASELRFEASFADPNGQVQTLSQAVTAWPASVVAGVRGGSWAQQGKPVSVDAVALSPDGQPQAGMPVGIRAVSRTIYSTRQRMVGGFYSYEHHTRSTDLGQVCEGKTDKQGLLRCETSFDRSGSIELIASVADDEGRHSEAATTVWVMGGEDLWFDAGNDDRIDVIPGKKVYEPGETAEFQVRMPFRHATALVAVEREGVLSSSVVELEGSDPRIRVPVRAEWGPNVYVSVLVLRGRLHQVPWYSFFSWGWKQPSAWLSAFQEGREYQAPTALIDLSKPAFRFGLAEIRVNDGGGGLKVEVKPDKRRYQVRDEAKVDIQVTTADGKPAAHGQVAFAAVDEALLELAANDSWKLLEAMHPRRSYGVQTATGQSQVVGRRHYGRKALPAGGGGGKSPTRELLDTLLLWRPDVQLDAQGRASLVVPLNDAITSFRLVALADEGVARFGEGQATIATTQDVQVISGLPALVREGDRYRASLTVRNTTERDMRLRVQAGYAGSGLPDGTLEPRTVSVAAGKAETLFWELTAPQSEQPDSDAELTWTLEASELEGEGAGDGLVVHQALAPSVPIAVQQAALQSVDESNPMHLSFAAPQGALRMGDGAPRGGLEVYLQSSLGGSLPGVVQWFKDYEYTCLEQLGSRAIGMRSMEQWRDLMRRLPDYLDGDGLASYFPGAQQGSEVLTAYLLAASHEARSLGLDFALPDGARESMRQGLLNFAQGRIARHRWAPTNDLPLRKLLVLEALAREGLMRPSLLDSIQIVPDRWPTSSVIDWLSILTRVKDMPRRAEHMQHAEQVLRARMLNRGTELVFAQSDDQWWLMRSPQVDAARLLSLVAGRPEWDEAMPRLAQGLMAAQRNGAWRTTTENLMASLAMQKFAQTYEQVPVSGRVHVGIDGAAGRSFDWAGPDAASAEAPAEAGGGFRSPSDVSVHRLLQPWPASGSGVLDVKQEGFGTVWVWTRSLAAVPIREPVVAGFELQRSVAPVSQARPDRWSPGDVYRVRLTIKARSATTWAVVSDPIPAGATILGSGLGRDSSIETRTEEVTQGPAPSYVERSFSGYRAYYEYLPQGETQIDYTVRLNTAGRFNMPPTRIEALYQPDVQGILPQAEPMDIRAD